MFWRILTHNPEQAGRLAEEFKLPPLVTRILAARGCTVENTTDMLFPTELHNPLSLKNMDAAVARILAARDKKETVLVVGDYDVDGVSGTVLLTKFFREIGIKPVPFIPTRAEGYGFKPGHADAAERAGASLIVTVDCGVSSRSAVERARSKNIDVIITDHHEPPCNLPRAPIINPKLGGYPFRDLSGTGVAHKVYQAVAKEAGLDPLSYIDLVTLATIADVMPLLGENRAVVTNGLYRLNENPSAGLSALCEAAGVNEVTAEAVAYYLSPRLNAAGRMGDPMLAFDLLFAKEPDKARSLAEKLNRLNYERQEMVNKCLEEATLQVNSQTEALDEIPDFITVVGNWEHGVIGLLASKLAEVYRRPALALSLDGDMARGSARSIPGFDLLSALRLNESILDKLGGHRMAAGLSVKRENIPGLAERLIKHARENITPEMTTRSVEIDATADVNELTVENIKLLNEIMEPCGQGFPAPIVAVEGLCTEAALIGDGKHLRLKVGGLTCIRFNCSEEPGKYLNKKLALAGRPAVNRWNGADYPQMLVQSVRPAGYVSRDTVSKAYSMLKEGKTEKLPELGLKVLEEIGLKEKDRAKLLPAEGRKSLFISPTYQMLGVEKVERRAG